MVINIIIKFKKSKLGEEKKRKKLSHRGKIYVWNSQDPKVLERTTKSHVM